MDADSDQYMDASRRYIRAYVDLAVDGLGN